jgi:hypothetical protein
MSAVLHQVVHDAELPYNSPRRPKTRGFGPLGFTGSLIALAGAIAGVIVIVFVSRLVGAGVFVLVLAFVVMAYLKDHHDHGPMEEAVERIGWLRQRVSRQNYYLPGTLTVFGDYLLPGTSAKSVLTQAEDTYGHSYALLTYPQTGHHVLNFRANPDGASLAAITSIDRTDTRFAKWLASLGTEPDLEQVAITMEIAPDAYPAVQREIDQNLKEGSPELSQQMLNECVAMYSGQGGASSRSYITMTFKNPSDLDKAELKKDSGASAMRESLATRLHDLMAPIPATGAGPIELMNEQDVIEVVRCAWNPEDQATYQDLKAKGHARPVLTWSSAGPTETIATRNWYSHGDGRSITWAATGFIGAQVAARTMKPMVADPQPSVHSMRITWLYKPIAPARAKYLAESDHRAAKQRTASSGKDPSERATVDANAAASARHAEAHGKGLLNYATVVTATVLEEDTEEATLKKIKRAKSAVEHVSPASSLYLRPMKGAQEPAFAQAVGPLGLVTSAHLLLPTSVRKAG